MHQYLDCSATWMGIETDLPESLDSEPNSSSEPEPSLSRDSNQDSSMEFVICIILLLSEAPSSDWGGLGVMAGGGAGTMCLDISLVYQGSVPLSGQSLSFFTEPLAFDSIGSSRRLERESHHVFVEDLWYLQTQPNKHTRVHISAKRKTKNLTKICHKRN